MNQSRLGGHTHHSHLGLERTGAIRRFRDQICQDDRTHAINWVPAVHANFLLMNVVAKVLKAWKGDRARSPKRGASSRDDVGTRVLFRMLTLNLKGLQGRNFPGQVTS